MDAHDQRADLPPEHPTLSSAMLDGVRNMDPERWSRLVESFGPIVYGWCRTSGVSETDASDLVQDVFIAVARGIQRFEPEKSQGSFRSWLATITRNKIRDFYRLRAKQQPAAGGTQAYLQLQQQPDDLDSTICPETAAAPVVRRVLRQVQAEFEVPTWQAFWMTVIDGKSTVDVAESLGISVDSVYQAKSRVLRKLRKRLSELPS